ncbi:MAG TPA: hypothetical protein VNZ49_16570 [Bacteroidia bacterium]|jgi:hypothetical protein|nr:hypothetical protein [Bacteroidia bacterium]
MKFRFLALVISLLSFTVSKAQMPGGGMGGNPNGMMSPQMANMPSGNSNTSKKDDPPHGGDIKEAGKYYIEVVFDPFSTEEKLNIWLLKSNYKAAKTDKAVGKAKIKYPKLDNKEEDKELILVEDRFYCNVSEPSATFTAFITITIKGKEYKMVFNQKGMAGR